MIVSKEGPPASESANKSLNPFAKSSTSSSSISSLGKEDGISSAGGGVSVLNSLKKMQKESMTTEGKKKRKAKSDGSASKPQRTPKAAKEAS